jgi:hypothetical protein
MSSHTSDPFAEDEDYDDLDDHEDDYDDHAWMCHCGHFEESSLHCSRCGNEPPWGCDCSSCSEPAGEGLEEWEYPDY